MGLGALRRHPTASAVVWAPTSASVPTRAWYRADRGVGFGTGSQVATLADQSGAGDANRNLNQATAGSRPSQTAADAAYGNQATLVFAGHSLPRTGTWSVTPVTPVTIIVIGNATAASAFLSEGATTDMIWTSADASGARFYSGGTNPVTSIAVSSPSAIMLTDDGTGGAAACKMYVNNLTTPAVSTTTNFLAANGIDLGVGVVGVANLTGKIAEVIVWAGIPSGTDMTNLRTYLNTTRAYGIAVT
jgi:hypothetical protein